MKRRDMLRMPLAAAAGSLASTAGLAQQACPADGTPAQFVPKKPADANPQVNDIEKYPKCPYCGMDRKQNHHTRVLIHYSDDLPDATCSLHCAAISLSINIDREPKATWTPGPRGSPWTRSSFGIMAHAGAWPAGGPAADQGVRPTIYAECPALGKLCGIFPAPGDSQLASEQPHDPNFVIQPVVGCLLPLGNSGRVLVEYDLEIGPCPG